MGLNGSKYTVCFGFFKFCFLTSLGKGGTHSIFRTIQTHKNSKGLFKPSWAEPSFGVAVALKRLLFTLIS